MSGCRNNICIRNRALVKTGCYQTSDMSHIDHQVCAYFVCNFTETFEINLSCIGTCTCNDQLRFCFQCNALYLFVINHAIVIDTIRHNVEI